MPRRRPLDPTIGDRIKTRRELLDWSIRYAASRAGVSHMTWSRIERGEQSADNRFVLAAIAEALRCPVSDLTGLAAATADPDLVEIDDAAYEAVRAVVDADLDYDPTTPPRPIEELRREVELIRDLRVRCDFLGGLKRLPAVLRALHATVATADRDAALELMVQAAEAAQVCVRYTRQQVSGNLIAERGKQAATMLGDPVVLGLSGWGLAQASLASGLYVRGATVAERAFDTLSPHADERRAKEMLGMLLLSSAFCYCALGQREQAFDRLDEAARLAEITGDTSTFELFFGPTNLGIWRVSMETDGGEPGKALELARDVHPMGIASPSRQSSYYLDTGRALARLRQDKEAVRMLLTAERLAPQRVRSDPLVAETARSLLERARRSAGTPELRGLCERVGVLVA